MIYALIVDLFILSKQQIVKRPELSLLLGGDRSLCRLIGICMIAKGKMFKRYIDLSRILLEHLLEYRHKLGTVRSLKVTEHRNGNRRILFALQWRPADVDLLGDINGNRLDGLPLLSQ